MNDCYPQAIKPKLFAIHCIISVYMASKSRVFVKSIQSLIGSIIGVGVFGIPFVFASAGYIIGIIHLAIIGFVSFILVYAYGEIIGARRDHHRLSGTARDYLGHAWSRIASIVHFCANWGAMLAYIIIGGEFLHALFSHVLNLNVLFYQILFFIVGAFILIGGLGLVSRVQAFTTVVLVVLFLAIIFGSVGSINYENLMSYDLKSAFLPFGVILFSFGGLGAVPEMRDILGREKRLLSKSIILGFLIIAILYILFSTVVVGVCGLSTSPEAILGLGDAVGQWVLFVGSIIGLFAVFTCFITLGVQVMDTAIYDYRARYFTGWGWAVSIPILLFLVGARDFIDVIGFTGGVFGVVIGLLVIAIYKKAKLTLPKRSLSIPDWLLDLSAVVLIIGMLSTIYNYI